MLKGLLFTTEDMKKKKKKDKIQVPQNDLVLNITVKTRKQCINS